MSINIFQMLDFINTRLLNIEKNINRIEEKIDFSVALQRNHLIRIKNGESISDENILYGRPYNDLSPKDAYDIYQDDDKDFIFIDVADKNFKIDNRPNTIVHIPLEELDTRYVEIHNKTTPILLISEKGLRSIQAAELLVKKGHFNINNISGGWEFWPGSKGIDLEQSPE